MGKIILYDCNKEMCSAWNDFFKNCEDVIIKNIKFEDVIADYVVTAGNSYGIMTGGIDLAVRNYYGYKIQDIIQEKLFFIDKHKLNPGGVLIIKTNDISKPNLVYACTMETPQRINPAIISYTMFNILNRCYEKSDSLAICGLGTGTGMVPYDVAAEESYEGYSKYKRRLLKK